MKPRRYSVGVVLDHLKRQGKIYNPVTENIINNTKRNRLSIQRQIKRYQKDKLVLISCSKSKAFTGNKTMRASEAYCSPLFQKSKMFAQDRGLDYAILSAKHGLVWPNEQISDYDLTLSELTPAEREKWSQNVAKEIHRWRSSTSRGTAKVIVLAGKSYTEPLTRELWNHIGITLELEEPLEGLQVGERLAKLNRENLQGKKWREVKKNG